MKKILYITLTILMLFTLVGCIKDNNNKKPEELVPEEIIPSSKELDIFYLNDFHGAVLAENGQIGISRISNLVIERKEKKPEKTLFITGGDMFQGQYISNTNRGELLVEAFNMMELDAFVLGNHEFDWGIDEIFKYFDPNTKGTKANFPLLGANVIDKRTNELPEFVKPYVIVEKDNSKVGIIGTIGDGQESSISAPRVKDYKFIDERETINKYVYEIKDEVDIIIVITHSDDQSLNDYISKLDKVELIFNGHRHMVKTGKVNNIPYLQAGTAGKALGHVNLKYILDSNGVNSVESITKNLNGNSYFELQNNNKEVDKIISKYYETIKDAYTDVIITTDENMTVDKLAYKIAEVMRIKTNAVIGIQNNGGTRGGISNNTGVTAANLFQVFPFDNQIVYTKIKGSKIKEIIRSDRFVINYDKNVIDELIDNEYYTVATNDYVFYQPNNGFLTEQLETEQVYGDMYETLLDVMKYLKETGYDYFNSNSPIFADK